MAESDPYSVRCEICETSFAPETKQCIHCGGPLGGGLMAALRAAGGEVSAQNEEEAQTPKSNKLWVVMALIGVGFSMLRQCA